MQNRSLSRLLALVCLILVSLVCLSLLVGHLKHMHGAHRRILSASAAGQRSDERMSFPWPQGTVDPNSAGPDELDALPGIGPVIAQSLIDERLANGPFFFPEDLLTVKGIGEKLLQKLWEHLSLPPPTYQ